MLPFLSSGQDASQCKVDSIPWAIVSPKIPPPSIWQSRAAITGDPTSKGCILGVASNVLHESIRSNPRSGRRTSPSVLGAAMKELAPTRQVVCMYFAPPERKDVDVILEPGLPCVSHLCSSLLPPGVHVLPRHEMSGISPTTEDKPFHNLPDGFSPAIM